MKTKPLIISNDRMKELADKVVYSFWKKYDVSHTVIRLSTSCPPKPEESFLCAARVSIRSCAVPASALVAGSDFRLRKKISFTIGRIISNYP
jgi:hypothetical protein